MVGNSNLKLFSLLKKKEKTLIPISQQQFSGSEEMPEDQSSRCDYLVQHLSYKISHFFTNTRINQALV